MRNLIFAINITVDGNCAHTEVLADDELHEYYTQLLRDVDLLVFGRKTYQLMIPHWPDVARNPSGETRAEIDFARAFDSIDKVVFSRSLDEADGKTRIVRATPRDEILKLKRARGKNILVGGVDLSSQLMELGLVDEWHFVVQPMISGTGRRLLEGGDLREKLRLRLVESRSFKSGCVALRYLKQ